MAIFFATVVHLIEDAGVFGLQIARGAEGKAAEVYLVLAFISGFSERFAQDIISRVSLSSGGPTAGRGGAGPGRSRGRASPATTYRSPLARSLPGSPTE